MEAWDDSVDLPWIVATLELLHTAKADVARSLMLDPRPDDALLAGFTERLDRVIAAGDAIVAGGQDAGLGSRCMSGLAELLQWLRLLDPLVGVPCRGLLLCIDARRKMPL